MFQNLDTTVTKFLGDYEITIIEFLDTVMPKYLEENDISVTKFLDRSIGEFLEANDVSVTKFMDNNDISVTKFMEGENDISVTKFLEDTAVSNYLGREHNRGRYEHESSNDMYEPRHAPRHEPRHDASGYPVHHDRYAYERRGPHHAERSHMGQGMEYQHHSDWD